MDEAGTSRLARRQRAALLVAVGAALVSTGGWAASSLVESPAERTVGAAPPPRSLLTAPVTLRALTPSVVARGEVYPPTRYEVTPRASSAEITQLFVSALAVRPGERVENGRLLAVVSGRPLFVLHGDVPAYRDLKPGSTGPDVAQLQKALEELGFGPGGDPEGSYGRGTAKAVGDYYRSIGQTAPTPGPETRQAVEAARRAVEADQRQLAETAADPERQAQLPEARRRLAADREALAKAEAADGPMVPAGEVVLLPAFPATVTAVNAPVGAPVSGPLLSLAGGGLAVTGRLTPAQAAGVQAGMTVELLAEVSGATARGTVSGLGAPTALPPAGRVIPIGGPAPAPADPAQPGPLYVPLQITTEQGLPAALNGQNVRLTVLQGPAAEPVPSVPVAAVFTDSAGRTVVTRVTEDGRREVVAVTTGVTVGGWVALTGGGLAAGDQVAVGS
ncbi:peptidoglycan-binding protein [Kitasatospora sp. NPDC051853]|uniref:peptidoglycan-binding protein n=1 Tax=Kitasatospora sp. NPDC051853 TaxID=3364058 RepID=UPI0037A2F9D2